MVTPRLDTIWVSPGLVTIEIRRPQFGQEYWMAITPPAPSVSFDTNSIVS
jgi:hypothetical protein